LSNTYDKQYDDTSDTDAKQHLYTSLDFVTPSVA
jgi:hypothetical protein